MDRTRPVSKYAMSSLLKPFTSPAQLIRVKLNPALLLKRLYSITNVRLVCLISADQGMYDPKLFQGDILLTDAQRRAIEIGGDVSRATVSKPVWPNAVLPYTIDSTMGR